VQEGLSVPVVGPSTIFPRGYLWQAPLWYAAALAVLLTAGWLPLFFRVSAVAGLTIAMATLIGVLCSITARAFSADENGVWLGLPSSTHRRGKRRRDVRYLPWEQLEKVRIARRRRGARVEFILDPGASMALRGYRHGPLWKARRAVLLLVPFWYVLRPIGVTSPLDKPARYQVRLHNVTVEELRQRFRALAPSNVTVTVLVRKRTSVSSPSSVPGAVKGPAYRAAGRWR
jgi:hypothetical protein